MKEGMEVLLFGITREIVGTNKLVIPDGVRVENVQMLRDWLNGQYKGLKDLSSLAIAVNTEYADDSLALNGTEEIALIPPVSGG